MITCFDIGGDVIKSTTAGADGRIGGAWLGRAGSAKRHD
jgi:hypothetical protein